MCYASSPRKQLTVFLIALPHMLRVCQRQMPSCPQESCRPNNDDLSSFLPDFLVTEIHWIRKEIPPICCINTTVAAEQFHRYVDDAGERQEPPRSLRITRDIGELHNSLLHLHRHRGILAYLGQAPLCLLQSSHPPSC